MSRMEDTLVTYPPGMPPHHQPQPGSAVPPPNAPGWAPPPTGPQWTRPAPIPPRHGRTRTLLIAAVITVLLAAGAITAILVGFGGGGSSGSAGALGTATSSTAPSAPASHGPESTVPGGPRTLPPPTPTGKP